MEIFTAPINGFVRHGITEIVIFIFLVGGAFYILNESGAIAARTGAVGGTADAILELGVAAAVAAGRADAVLGARTARLGTGADAVSDGSSAPSFRVFPERCAGSHGMLAGWVKTKSLSFMGVWQPWHSCTKEASSP